MLCTKEEMIGNYVLCKDYTKFNIYIFDNHMTFTAVFCIKAVYIPFLY